MFAKCFAIIILKYVPEGSGSWKYNHHFPVAEGKGKIRKLLKKPSKILKRQVLRHKLNKQKNNLANFKLIMMQSFKELRRRSSANIAKKRFKSIIVMKHIKEVHNYPCLVCVYI